MRLYVGSNSVAHFRSLIFISIYMEMEEMEKKKKRIKFKSGKTICSL